MSSISLALAIQESDGYKKQMLNILNFIESKTRPDINDFIF